MRRHKLDTTFARREWISDELTMFRSWSLVALNAVRWPIVAWAVVALAHVLVNAGL